MMAADSGKHSSRRRGFTLIEIMIAVAVLTVLITYVLIGLRQQVHLGTLRQYLQDLDMQGSRIMQECAFRLRPAILPVWTDSDKDNPDKAAVFRLLDNPANGFRGGEGRAWGTALAAGVDRIAFVVPVDAQGDGDTVDGANRMEAGQIRSTGVSLDSAFIPGGADGIGFTLNPAAAAPACSLVRVSPALLAQDSVGGAEDISGWPAALYGAGQPPQTSAFSVIRYVPVMNGGTPVLIFEDENINDGIGVDLNGDGDRNDTFNIGRLQLVHVGGTHAVQPPTTPGNPVDPAMTSGIPHETVDLSADVVLREVNPPTPPPPMFRYAGDGSPALEVRVNLFDPNGYQALRARAPNQQRDSLNRVFETVLTLRNMAR